MMQENVFTYVLGFGEKNNVLMQKNGLLARTSYQIKPLRLKRRPLDGLGHVVELPLRIHYNVFAEGCLLDLSPTLVVEKTGPIEEQAIPGLKLSSLFAVRLFCALSACFMHVFSLLELLTEAVHAVHVSRQCGCHEGLKPKVSTP